MKVIVSLSGGKDSTAVALLAKEQGVDALYAFADTGHEHPETYRYLDYLERELGITVQHAKADLSKRIEHKRHVVQTKWRDDGVSEEKIEQALAVLVPTGNPFLDLCLWKGRFPSTRARFCTEELKVMPIMEQVILPALREHGEIEQWHGVRADESLARSKLPEREIDDSGSIIFRPILHWTVEDVFAMHHKHGIKPNPLYMQGMKRVGCMPCINCGKEELRQIGMRFPEELDRVQRWEEIVRHASKRHGANFFAPRNGELKGMDNEHIHEANGIWSHVEWANTSRGGRQIDMINVLEDPPICHSAYGLCE